MQSAVPQMKINPRLAELIKLLKNIIKPDPPKPNNYTNLYNLPKANLESEGDVLNVILDDAPWS